MLAPSSFRYRRNAQQQSGIALLTMLLVFAMVAALAGEMIYNQTLATRKTEASLYGRQAREYALGGEALARQILFKDWEQDNQTQHIADHGFEDWAGHFAPFEPDNGKILLSIIDGESRFNLNNLIDATGAPNPAQLATFKRLLSSLGLDGRIAEAVVDWLDSNQQPLSINTEDQGYLGKTPAYRTADRKMAQVSELQAVEGVTPEAYQLLLPHLVALPARTAININTVTPRLLEAVFPGMRAEAVMALRTSGDEAFTSVEAFLQHSITAGLPVPGVPLSVTSEYFQVSVAAWFDNRQQALQSWVQRYPGDGRIRLLGREFISPVDVVIQQELPNL